MANQINNFFSFYSKSTARTDSATDSKQFSKQLKSFMVTCNNFFHYLLLLLAENGARAENQMKLSSQCKNKPGNKVWNKELIFHSIQTCCFALIYY